MSKFKPAPATFRDAYQAATSTKEFKIRHRGDQLLIPLARFYSLSLPTLDDLHESSPQWEYLDAGEWVSPNGEVDANE